MSGGRQRPPRGAPHNREPDFASRLARAEFGRHYVDPSRLEQTLEDGAVVLSDKTPRWKGRGD